MLQNSRIIDEDDVKRFAKKEIQEQKYRGVFYYIYRG